MVRTPPFPFILPLCCIPFIPLAPCVCIGLASWGVLCPMYPALPLFVCICIGLNWPTIDPGLAPKDCGRFGLTMLGCPLCIYPALPLLDAGLKALAIGVGLEEFGLNVDTGGR